MEGLAATSGANIKTMTQQLNQPASNYSTSSYGTSTTESGGSTTSTSTGGTSRPAGSSTTTTTSGESIYTTPIISPTNNPATSYSIPRKPTSGIVEQYPSAPSTHTTPPPIEGTPPSVQLPPSTYNQVVSEIPSVTKQLQGLAPATETTTTTPTGVAHLWIGWKIEPWEEEVIQKFIEAFEHGKHVHHPPIMLPMMGGSLAPAPGAPAVAPGTNQQGLAIKLP